MKRALQIIIILSIPLRPINYHIILMNISLQDQAHVRDLIRFAVFSHCVHDSYQEVCPWDYNNTAAGR